MSLKDIFSVNGIPALFWYTLSFCMLSITIMLCWVFYNSQTVSFEIANTKIEMVNNVFQMEQVVESLKKKESELEVAKSKFEESVKKFNDNLKSNTPVPETAMFKTNLLENKKNILGDVDKSIEKLKNQTQQISKP